MKNKLIIVAALLFVTGIFAVNSLIADVRKVEASAVVSATPCNPKTTDCPPATGTPTATPTVAPTATPTSTPTATPTAAPTPTPTFAACGPVSVDTADLNATIAGFTADGCTSFHLQRNPTNTRWAVYGVRIVVP